MLRQFKIFRQPKFINQAYRDCQKHNQETDNFKHKKSIKTAAGKLTYFKPSEIMKGGLNADYMHVLSQPNT